MDKSYTIGELADTAGVTSRTIRFYTSEGLIPPPVTSGRIAIYSDDHLKRLRLIQQLKEAFLPLHAIRTLLENESAETLTQKVEIAEERSGPHSGISLSMPVPAQQLRESAAEYIRKVTESVPTAPPAPAASVSRSSVGAVNAMRGLFDRKPPVLNSQQWERIVISSEFELHARNPRSPEAQRLIDRLMEVIRRHPLKED